MNKKDFLVEIGCEELPPKNLTKLATAFADGLKNGLQKIGINYEICQIFATPRRLAVLIHQLEGQQPDQIIERRGPMLVNAFTADRQPTPATIGFANSCNVSIDDLEKLETPKGVCLFYKQKKLGSKTEQLLPEIVKQSLAALPIPRPMTWNNGEVEFIRPVHWVVMLFGNKPIVTEILGIESGAETVGHRFLFPHKIKLENPLDYAEILAKKAYIIADFEKRKEKIRQLLKNIVPQNGDVIIDDELLNEVTGIVEWPVALLGKFDERFLQLPREVLISSMQKHQKCFPMIDARKNVLLPCFAAISNIESKQPERVIAGNERVINARLTDAEFFYNTDTKKPLEDYLQNLSGVIFQTGLGNMYDKAQRLSSLASFMAAKVVITVEKAARAGLLAKADLATEMVGEFPELQGIMGFYYAVKSREEEAIAMAIKEHYLPNFAGDNLPQTTLGDVVAIADRLDLLVGIIGINKTPTGDKDPLGLRRAALGMIRIILEKRLNLDLQELIIFAKSNYNSLFNQTTVEQTLDFIYERLRGFYLEKNVIPQIFNAVLMRQPTNLLDFDERIRAVVNFNKLAEAESLAIANKRVSNILQKSEAFIADEVHPQFLIETAEKELMEQINNREEALDKLRSKRQYTQILELLAELKPFIDTFFDKVMVMVEDDKIRANRLALLAHLRRLFLYCADISVL